MSICKFCTIDDHRDHFFMSFMHMKTSKKNSKKNFNQVNPIFIFNIFKSYRRRKYYTINSNQIEHQAEKYLKIYFDSRVTSATSHTRQEKWTHAEKAALGRAHILFSTEFTAAELKFSYMRTPWVPRAQAWKSSPAGMYTYENKNLRYPIFSSSFFSYFSSLVFHVSRSFHLFLYSHKNTKQTRVYIVNSSEQFCSFF